jgi:hypothetical protein
MKGWLAGSRRYDAREDTDLRFVYLGEYGRRVAYATTPNGFA